MVFDARAAKLLQEGKALAIASCPGLRLQAMKNLKTWTYRYKTPEGKLKQVAIGPWPTLSLQDAMARWLELRGQRVAGVDPAQLRKVQRSAAKATPQAAKSYTVDALVRNYIDGHLLVSRKAQGATAAKNALERLLEEDPEFAAMDAAQVSRGRCFTVLDKRKGRPTAAAKLRSLLGSAWDYGLDSGKLDGDVPNWWRQVMRGRLKSKGKVMGGQHIGRRRRVLNDDEVGELLRWLPNLHSNGRDGLVLYLWTGARGSEIFGMRPEFISQERGEWWWTVPKEETKNARHELAEDLRVPLFGRALEIVQRRMKTVGKSGLLFENGKGEQYAQRDFSGYIYDLQSYSPKGQRRKNPATNLPVGDWTPHNLRRTSRTMLAAIGCPSEIAEAIIGHMPDEIEATYNLHSYDAERRHWLQRLDAHLEALATDGAPARP